MNWWYSLKTQADKNLWNQRPEFVGNQRLILFSSLVKLQGNKITISNVFLSEGWQYALAYFSSFQLMIRIPNLGNRLYTMVQY